MKEKTYKVIITETSSRIVTISKDEVQSLLNVKSDFYNPTPADICDAVRRKWNNEEIVLDASDFDEADFALYHNGQVEPSTISSAL